jgi:hypothetical protein
VIVNPVLYPPEFWTTISPPGSTTVRAWLKERQGWAAEQGFVSLPVVDTKERGMGATVDAVGTTPASARQMTAITSRLKSAIRLVIFSPSRTGFERQWLPHCGKSRLTRLYFRVTPTDEGFPSGLFSAMALVPGLVPRTTPDPVVAMPVEFAAITQLMM